VPDIADATAPETLEVGAELPPFTRTVDFANWNRYAAVNDEFVPIHMDDEAGQAAGYPGAFGMGNLQIAYLHLLLRGWMGVDRGRIVEVGCQLRGPTLKGEQVTARGRITGVRAEGDEVVVELDVWTEGREGQPIAPGRAVVALPS
jgi:acyl dehydratase